MCFIRLVAFVTLTIDILVYGKAVDWWSFGTLIYEMMTGLPPFYCEDVQQMYTKIMTAELTIPETMSPEAGDLIRKVRNKLLIPRY